MQTSVLEDSQSALALMRGALRDGAAFEDEYPLVFGADAPGRVVAVRGEDESIIGACATLVRELVFPGGRLATGLIGSVCTREDQRGRGVASAVLRRAESELAAAGAALSILWADEPDFYTRRGYQQFGAELDFALPRALAKRLPQVAGVREITEDDLGRVHELYEAGSSRVARSKSETRALLFAPGVKVRVHEAGGVVDAYACYERGGDLERVVHEWCGEAKGVLACVRSWLEPLGEGDAIFLMAPGTDSAVASELRALEAPSAQGILGMAKVIDEGRLLDELCAAAADPITFQSLSGGLWRVVGRGGVVELTRERLLHLVLPPAGDRSALEAFENVLGVSFPGLPRAAFLWGLDSI